MSLLAVTGPLVDSARVQALAATHGLDVKVTELATNSKRVEDGDIPSSSFDFIVSVGRPGDHELTYMTVLSRVLRPGGRLTIVEDGVSGASLRKHLTLAGLTLADENEGVGTVTAMKPAWETGARLALRGGAASTVSVGVPSQPAAQPSWKLSGLDDDADDLIDEDDLLTDADRAGPDPASCSKPKAKPCKNCTCGRAEEENAGPVKLTKAMLDNPTSGCGSCALGDAYRCGTCPYLGLPSFELGKKIELPSNFLVSDL